jgi:hypothetical protein
VLSAAGLPAESRERLAGILMALALSASIVAGVADPALAVWSGGAFWLAAVLLWPRLIGLQRLQTLLMLGIGVSGLLYASLQGHRWDWMAVISGNQALLAMLASVTFLRLISLPASAGDEAPPTGRRALWRTLLGVHLFGAVINLSAVMILGDRQSARQPLTALQAVTLSRGFALAAHWSPFFAAMGIALSHAPGSDLATLSLFGVPLALLGLSLSALQLARWPGVDSYAGYPMRFGALWVPAVLAVAVMLLHAYLPDLPVLTLISLLAIVVTFFVLAVREARRSTARMLQHVQVGLPRMAGELALFLAAAVLGAGLAAVIANSGWQPELDRFGAFEAWVLLVAMVVLSLFGVHPIISIATAQGMLATLPVDPNMIGITYLMAWATGVSISPFSGLHLGMQGRFGIDARGFLRWNGSFTVLMLAIHALALHAYEAFFLG